MDDGLVDDRRIGPYRPEARVISRSGGAEEAELAAVDVLIAGPQAPRPAIRSWFRTFGSASCGMMTLISRQEAWMLRDAQIPAPWGVSSYGAASVKAAPDLVRIRLVVQQIKPSPKKAFEGGQANVADLRGVLRGHHIPDAAVSASRLRLNSEWQGYGKEREFLGYKCEASFTIESENLDGLQQLLIDVVNAGVDRVDEVEFDVRAKAELRAQARRAAVQAARAKAQLYADAAGVRLGSVLHIQDVDPESVGNERYRGHGSGGATAEEDLAPGHVVVSAAVVLGFALADQ